MRDFIKNLKVGDTVIVKQHHKRSVRKIDRITPKGFIGIGSMLFNKDGFERSGDRWFKAFLVEATPKELKEAIEEETLREAYNLMRKAIINVEQAEKIISIFKGE